MKGVVFNLLEDFIAQGWGEDVLDDILGVCPLHTQEPFVGPGTYPDADLFAIVGAACARLSVPPEVAVRSFGRFCFPELAARAPQFIQAHEHPKSFLLSLQDVIHVEVEKLFPGAETPDFLYEDLAADRLAMTYLSKRRLCFFAEGLIEGASAHYGVPVEQHQSACVHHGAQACRFELRFAVPLSEAA